MDEVLGSVSMLAQDQYGNYVIQVCNLVVKDPDCWILFASIFARAVRSFGPLLFSVYMPQNTGNCKANYSQTCFWIFMKHLFFFFFILFL